MKYILRLLLSAAAVIILSEVLPNVSVDNYITAVIVALALSLLNFIVKPVLVILTLPVTIFTFGLFLLVINAIIIKLADYFITEFSVDGWLWAIIFSLLLSLLQSILFSVLKTDQGK